MKKLLVLAAIGLFAILIFFAADRAASVRRSESPERFEEIFKSVEAGGGLQVVDMKIYASRGEAPQAMPQESYLCLWSSFTVDAYPGGCDVTIETIDALCNPVAGYLTTASAFYLANAKKVSDYYALGSVTWGYLPGLPSGWCWTLIVDYAWGGIPYLPDEYWFDRAAAYNHGNSVPPIQGYCGWPLSTLPDPFLVHCP
jgi:hypothetical protein